MVSDVHLDLPHEDAWDAWSPQQLDHRLESANVPWYVVGGWALDLWLGTVRRTHDDLEFAIAPSAAPDVARMLPELTFFEATQGVLSKADTAAPMDEGIWQWWGADLGRGCWRVDMMAERGTPDRWHYKRDPTLALPRVDAVRTGANGIRYLAPSLVLLFKAKHRRPKDDADFDAVVSKLDDWDRKSLRGWLRDLHPDHAWIAKLTN